VNWRGRGTVLAGDIALFFAILAGHVWGGLDQSWVLLAGGNLLGSLAPKGVVEQTPLGKPTQPA
jgi:hypothetical protein